MVAVVISSSGVMNEEEEIKDWDVIKRGDVKTFERMFKSYYDELCHYGNTFLGDPELAEDVVQDAFVYFWNHREQIELKVSLKAYLYTSVRHGALNVIKKQALERRHNPLLTEFIQYLETSDYSEKELEDIEKVKKAMDILPAQCRIVFEKSCIDGMKYKEIADTMNISVNTVKSHIVKAYRLIKIELKDEINTILLLMIFQR